MQNYFCQCCENTNTHITLLACSAAPPGDRTSRVRRAKWASRSIRIQSSTCPLLGRRSICWFTDRSFAVIGMTMSVVAISKRFKQAKSTVMWSVLRPRSACNNLNIGEVGSFLQNRKASRFNYRRLPAPKRRRCEETALADQLCEAARHAVPLSRLRLLRQRYILFQQLNRFPGCLRRWR